MTVRIHFRAIAEDEPGPRWAAAFARTWPDYRAWFLRGGGANLPSYVECRRALRQHMPELVPVWQRLVERAGGGDVEARFLSMWCPPAYILGCSQTVWIDVHGGAEAALVRNYDFAPALLEGTWLATRWLGTRVVALGDCSWGVLDGMNASGLSLSLSFGGRTGSGTGFGIPLVLRYVLETCTTVAAALDVLRRVPVHMTYNVTLLDARPEWATVFVSPDRPPEVLRRKSVTNFQHRVEWPKHARATHSVERLKHLEALTDAGGGFEQLLAAMLRPPLYQTSWDRGYGTLYTAAYRPQSRTVELCWPAERWAQRVDAFTEGEREIAFVPLTPQSTIPA